MSWPFPTSPSTKSLPSTTGFSGRNPPGRSVITPQRSRSFSSRPAQPPPMIPYSDPRYDSSPPSTLSQPLLLPKDSPISPSDPLLRAVRMKMSSMDQEAMRKVRSTMELRDGLGSTPPSSRPPSSGHSPDMSTFPNSSQNTTPLAGPSRMNGEPAGYGDVSSSAREMRPRRSTLSNVVTAENEPHNDLAPKSGAGTNHQVEPAKYRIAVIGHAKTGKTTLINRAFRQYGVTEPVEMKLESGDVEVHTYRSTIMPAGKIKLWSECKVFEIDLALLPTSTGSPSSTSEGFFPRELSGVDGALIVFDATSKESFEGVAAAVQRLSDARLPAIVFACKTDEDGERVVEPEYANSFIQPYNVGLIETTDRSSEGRSKMRNGLRYLLLKMESRAVKQRRPLSRPPSPSPASKKTSTSQAISTQDHRMMWHDKGDHQRNASFGNASIETGGTASKRGSVASQNSSGSLHWIMQGPLVSRSNSISGPGAESVRRSSQKGVPRRASSSINRSRTDSTGTQTGSVENHAPLWTPIEELLNQLFTNIVSTKDETFVRAFFLCYRRFYLPRDLMAQFLSRLKEIETYDTSRDVKHWALQKLTGALIDWTDGDIGDLADMTTRRIFQEIISFLLNHTFMAHLTAQLVVIEESLLEDVVDLDASWVLKPTADPETASVALPSSFAELLIGDELLYDFDTPSLGHSGIDTPSTKDTTLSLRTVSTHSMPVEESLLKTGRPDATSGQLDGSAHREGQNVQLRWSGAVGYVQAMDPKMLAAELTRAQWQVFSVLRARDVFRHDMGKERNGPVARAVSFFNHVARWTTTLILSEPKPKHRARVYERFMLIAYHLRRLNNYESLHAVLSGMGETSVARLAQTHALVQPSPEVVKGFESNKKLMDPMNGYMSYRLALSADVSNGKPAIPLMMTILPLVVRLQSMRSEDMREDGSVQWEKFQRFEEILRVIPECQSRGCPISGLPSATFTMVLHDTPVIDDEDELYDRSRSLEPAGSRETTSRPMLKMLGKIAI